MSHNRTVSSDDAEHRYFEFFENEQHLTDPAWPCNVVIFSTFSTSHNITRLSIDPVASIELFGEHAKQTTDRERPFTEVIVVIPDHSRQSFYHLILILTHYDQE